MIESGFYKISQDYIDIIRELGGRYNDAKERPIYCCFVDKFIKGMYWMIPTGDLSHRTPEQIQKIKEWCALNERDIRWAYCHIGHTNRDAVYRISNCFPVIPKYIDAPYISQGIHLVLHNSYDIEIIKKKISRILFAESKNPNKFEQHITDIRNRLIEELNT